MKQLFSARQGDIYFSQIDKIPLGTKKVVSGVISHSDNTNHTHRLIGGVLTVKEGKQYTKVIKKATVVHNEHRTITLPKGLYEVRRQREYTKENMSRLVQD